MKDFIYKHEHSAISILLMLVSIPFGVGLYTMLILSGIWIGREHSQAEYRYMKLNRITRKDLGFFDGFKPASWDKDSFLNDLLIPIAVMLIIYVGGN